MRSFVAATGHVTGGFPGKEHGTMFDKSRLREALVDYKRDFVSIQWKEEYYKWVAVKWFQDHWDVKADDFAGMLHQSLEKTSNLLDSQNHFPRNMIEGFAETAPEEVRAMFLDLFDEKKDVYDRIEAFKDQSSVLLKKYGNGALHHYQDENAISVYLWLRFPDQYYIYKFTEVKCVSEELNSSYRFKKGAYRDNLHNLFDFYNMRNPENGPGTCNSVSVTPYGLLLSGPGIENFDD